MRVQSGEWLRRWVEERPHHIRFAMSRGPNENLAADLVDGVTTKLLERAIADKAPFAQATCYPEVRSYGRKMVFSDVINHYRDSCREARAMRQTLEPDAQSSEDVVVDADIEEAWKVALGRPAEQIGEILAELAACDGDPFDLLAEVCTRFNQLQATDGDGMRPVGRLEVFLQFDRLVKAGVPTPDWLTAELRFEVWGEVLNAAPSFSALGPSDAVMVASRLAGMSHAEAAVKLQSTAAAARKRWSRLLRRWIGNMLASLQAGSEVAYGALVAELRLLGP